ncbi:hypothetical protein LTR97_006974 [Elasticomyces elasticus]|uniref:F-box domain-containing protein n=1 Tax=Elasticomyces elasticus TaxID=574655 RepID=A0AAN7ZTL4_9PEZI|nr:hypothetical protein LTR97_006974 [Elasticomyces elasticus]
MAQQVLHLPELLENILLRLPMKDLLFSQKVCRTWKAVVDTSPHIQEALFYTGDARDSTPTSAAKARAYSGHPCRCSVCKFGNNGVLLNPLLMTSPENGGEVGGLRNLLNGVSPAQASCHGMLLGRPTKEMEIYIELQEATDFDLSQLDGRDMKSVQICYTYTLWAVEEAMAPQAKFTAGTTFGDTKQRYKMAVKELRGKGFEVCDAGWAISHVEPRSVRAS